MGAQTAYPVINLVETGRCIERRRRQAGLTVRELQAYFGFEYPQAIYKWQHGECLPTVDNLLALARLLQVSMEDLLVYEDRGVSHFFTSCLCRSIRSLVKSIFRYLFSRPFYKAVEAHERLVILSEAKNPVSFFTKMMGFFAPQNDKTEERPNSNLVLPSHNPRVPLSPPCSNFCC